MSPQFVDFDADGQLDIVAGIFDGSPHLSRGSKQGWQKPEQILGRDGKRIVLNAFWNFDTKKWDSTHAYDAPGHEGDAHATSTLAFDVDGDGDLDLLLGDHKSGRVFWRRNDGAPGKPEFDVVNLPVTAAGKPIDVPGTVATMRLVDWNGDGKQDLACGSMGGSFGDGDGGGVWVWPNVGDGKAAAWGAPIELIARSKQDHVGDAPARPDAGLYMDFGDVDGDGDLDLAVGAYSHWRASPKPLDAAQQERVAALQAALKDCGARFQQVLKEVNDGLGDAAGEARDRLYSERYTARQSDFQAISKDRSAAQKELDTLVPPRQRKSFVWLYENLAAKKAAAPAK